MLTVFNTNRYIYNMVCVLVLAGLEPALVQPVFHGFATNCSLRPQNQKHIPVALYVSLLPRCLTSEF